MRAASLQDPVEEGAEVRSPAGVATSGGLHSPLRPGEGEGEGEETGAFGITTTEQAPSPPPYPQDEAGIPAAAAAAEVGEEDEEHDDEPPDYLLAEADAGTLFHRGVRLLQLVHTNVNELDEVHSLAGGRPAAVEARRNITLADADLRQAFDTINRDFERDEERRTELVNQLTDLNGQLRRELHEAGVHLHRQRDRADAAHQLRNNLELLVHQAHLQNQQQQMELLAAAPEIQQLFADRDMAARDAEHWEEEAQGLRLQNAQLEEEVAAIAADNAHNVREADAIHAELHRWHRMAVRLNNERAPEDRYELPNIAHEDEVDDLALQYEAGHEFDEVLPALPHPTTTEDVELAEGHAGPVIAQPEQVHAQIEPVEADWGIRYLQPRVEDYPDDVDSDAETLLGEASR